MYVCMYVSIYLSIYLSIYITWLVHIWLIHITQIAHLHAFLIVLFDHVDSISSLNESHVTHTRCEAELTVIPGAPHRTKAFFRNLSLDWHRGMVSSRYNNVKYVGTSFMGNQELNRPKLYKNQKNTHQSTSKQIHLQDWTQGSSFLNTNSIACAT